jgi:hypothetical protein
MGATLATVDNILKEIYEGSGIQDQLQSETVTAKRIKSSSEGVTEEVGGKYVTFPLRIKRNQGIGARRENEALPNAGNQGYVSARVGLSYQYGKVQLTGQTFELADKNFQAFASALDQEINGLKQDLAKDQNRQVYGTSIGTIATCTTLGSSVNTFKTTNTQYIQDGMMVDVVDGTTLSNTDPTVVASNRMVTAISKNTQVTLSGAAFSSAVGDVLVRTGSVTREVHGLGDIVNDSGTLYNVDPSSVPLWKAKVDSNSGTARALSELLMINMVDSIREGGSKVSAIFTTLGVRRSYFALLTQQRRYTGVKEFEGGFTGLAFTTDQGEIPVVVDTDTPTKSMYFLSEKEIKLYQTGEWDWMNRDGSNWQRVITSSGSYDAYEATLYKYMDYGTHKRNAHGKIVDIIES